VKKHIVIDYQCKEKIYVLKITGFMDMSEVIHFKQYLDRLIMGGKTQIVLDFSELEYISSAGLGVLIGRTREIRRQNGDLKIGGCSSRVYGIFKVIGLTDVFDVAKDVFTAIKKFKE